MFKQDYITDVETGGRVQIIDNPLPSVRSLYGAANADGQLITPPTRVILDSVV